MLLRDAGGKPYLSFLNVEKLRRIFKIASQSVGIAQPNTQNK